MIHIWCIFQVKHLAMTVFDQLNATSRLRLYLSHFICDRQKSETHTCIRAGYFARHQTISKVIFESGSKRSSIEEEAFRWGSPLWSISIPSSVETLGNQCFADCESLSTVRFESGSKLSSLGESVFCQCPKKFRVDCPASL
jgi:hypothetical protein